jgi:histidyl-tRNA synthetase
VSSGAPRILDYLCGDCSGHFEKLKARLDTMGIKYAINPGIVRGLDYYTKTVFEFVSSDIGAQGAICGGGRYDGLFELLGGKPSPALGYAMGIERLILAMRNQNIAFLDAKRCDLYIAVAEDAAAEKAAVIAKTLRDAGFYAEYDTMDRGLKAQMKHADRIGAAFCVVLGGLELKSGAAQVKNMRTGEVFEFRLNDGFADAFSSKFHLQ